MSIRWIIPDKKLSMSSLKAMSAGPMTATASRRTSSRAAVAARAQAWWLTTLNEGLPTHDPPLPVRDEAIFLLHTAAEIEHSLLVQYLFAAYSLKSPEKVPEHAEELTRWRETLKNIAKEEMGHLMTVQNLLLLLGAPLNFEREDAPFRHGLYPFHFRLEPVSKASLAKYVLAEKPEDPQHQLLSVKQEKQLRMLAKCDGAKVINRVGALYAKLVILFSSPNDKNLIALRNMLPGLESELDKHLSPDDLLPADSPGLALQAPTADWSLDQAELKVFVPTVKSLAQARTALLQIMEQGEAGSGTTEGEMSHFQRFWKLFQEFPEAAAWRATRSVAVNPNTLLDPPAPKRAGNITNSLTRSWAELFNLRYRLVLDVLAHYLQVVPVEAPQFVAKRNFLVSKAITEMGWLRALADKLTEMDCGATSRTGKAGPPFELPDSMSLPHRDEELWRWHLKLHEEIDRLVDLLSPQETSENQEFLSGLKLSDDEKTALSAFAAGVPSNGGGGGGGSATTSFQRDILPLFRPIDIAHMRFALDLSSYDDVKANSQNVLDRLQGIGGDVMPPDAPWAQDRIDLFARWISEGHPV